MSNLKKAFLAVLMLAGFTFSTNSFAWVDCSGLPDLNSTGHSEIAECEEFNSLYGGDWKSRKTGAIRYENKKWNGIQDFKPSLTKKQKELINILYINPEYFSGELNFLAEYPSKNLADSFIKKDLPRAALVILSFYTLLFLQ